jgi:hypothetical protein
MTKSKETATEKNAPLLQSAVTETSKKISSSLLPSIENHVQNEKFDKKDGLDFLDAKNSIMLSYMIDLTLLLKLKACKNKDTKQIEECLGRLREMKIVLEKVRPLEKKMRYQLDKLLALSASSSDFAAAANNSPTIVESAGDVDGGGGGESSDPLAFRPNPESMLGKDDHEGDDDASSSDNEMVKDSDDNSGSSDDEEDDEELMAARAALNAGRSKKKSYNQDNDDEVESTGVYRAPRLATTHFMEKEKQADKEERMLKKQRDRMRKSEVLSTLKATFGDAPEEDDFSGGAALGKQREASRRFNERMEEKEKYEEDTMIRITDSRKEKKLRKKIMREEHSNLNSIADLDDIAAGVTAAFGGEKKGKGSRGEDPFQSEDGQSSRLFNGKRRREDGGDNSGGRKEEEERRPNPKNSFQKALYGMEGGAKRGGAGKKKKGGRRK